MLTIEDSMYNKKSGPRHLDLLQVTTENCLFKNLTITGKEMTQNHKLESKEINSILN